MAAGLENGQLFFNVVFFVVFISALVQGSTISYFAKMLDLIGPEKSEPMHSLELISIGKANAEMVEYEIQDDNPNIIGKRLAEIDFPKDALINAIIRGNDLIPPTGNTQIQVGDILYILVSRSSKPQLTQLLKEENPKIFDPILRTEG